MKLDQGTIRYKVINKDDRSSAFLGKHNLKFTLFYHKGVLIRAKKDTLGIFVFETKQHAKFFVKEHDEQRWIIIPVLGIGKGTKLLQRPIDFGTDIIIRLGKEKNKIIEKQGLNLGQYLGFFSRKDSYDGTILYDAVIPLE